MKYGPDIASIAALIGDPARANILTALMDGGALSASELATEAGVTKQTASLHLSKLLDAEFVAVEQQGRHRYFRLADHDVARILEALMGIAARRKPRRLRTGPKEPALRKARVCYDHLAGDLGVALFDGLQRNGWLADQNGQPVLTDRGTGFLGKFGIDFQAMGSRRRPVCLTCLDWSVRRSHLAGALGAALFSKICERGWAKRVEGTRIVDFSAAGETAFRTRFALDR